MRCEEKVPYASGLLAGNAAWLHRALHPACSGIHAYVCRDHWHVGHVLVGGGEPCKAEPDGPRWRPARWSKGRRHPSKRPARR